MGIGLRSGRIDAYTLGLTSLAVVDEDVCGVVCVADYQVGCVRPKCYIPPISTDTGIVAAAGLRSGRIDAYTLGNPGLAVVDEDVCIAICVAGYQVGCL